MTDNKALRVKDKIVINLQNWIIVWTITIFLPLPFVNYKVL